MYCAQLMRDLFAIAKFLVVMADKILFKKIEDLFLSPLMTQVQLHFQRSACNTHTWDVIMTSCRTETETISRRMEKDGPSNFCYSHQSVSGVAVSLLVSRFSLDVLSTLCDRFVVQYVKFMLSKFLHLCILLFDYSVCRQNDNWNVLPGMGIAQWKT